MAGEYRGVLLPSSQFFSYLLFRKSILVTIVHISVTVVLFPYDWQDTILLICVIVRYNMGMLRARTVV